MPFCNQCGHQVGAADKYCGRCGRIQPLIPGSATGGPGTPVPVDPLAEVPPKTLAVLCYVPVVGFVSSIIVLSARRFRRDLPLRFHAFQGLYIFAAWLLVDWAVDPIFHLFPHHGFGLDHLLHLALIFVWIFMLIKTYQGKSYSLPVFGELAQRSAHEH